MSTHKRATAAANLRLHKALTAKTRSELDKHDTDRLNFPINVGIAVAALGLSIASGLVLPLPAYKFLVGVAFITAVVSVGVIVHRRFFKPDEPAESGVDTAS
jgi:hypothetical protein